MIEVTVIETGDCAEAETPDAAIFAARTIGREARQHIGRQGFNPTLRFVNTDTDEVIRLITLRDLDR